MEKRTVAFEYLCINETELTTADRELIKKARTAARSSYAPYSHFHVGAAVRLIDGTIVCGSNQENAAYPSGLCAERVALYSANANFPALAVTDLAIAAWDEKQFISHPVPPCGACRQVMLQTSQRFNHPIRLVLAGSEIIYIVPDAASLLPLQFEL